MGQTEESRERVVTFDSDYRGLREFIKRRATITALAKLVGLAKP